MNQRQQSPWSPQQRGQFKWPPQSPQLPSQSLHSSPIQVQPQLRIQQQQTLPLYQVQKMHPKHKQRRSRGKRRRRWFLCNTMLIILLIIVFFGQANGVLGAHAADVMRAALGPAITARFESQFLGVSDTAHQLQYQLSGEHVDAPWAVQAEPTPAPHPAVTTVAPMTLTRIASIVTPAVVGEGAWSVQGSTGAPYNFPLVAKAFIRPDPARPYAIVTLLQFDTRFILMHMVAGTSEPGGPRHMYGLGVIPAGDQKGNVLLAAFNGGFKYADGQYGMEANGVLYVPPVPGVATIGVTKEGQIILGAWGVDPRLKSSNADLVAWRQNAALLLNHGVINPLTTDGASWGGTVLNQAYTWRSGIGITAQGTLIYAAGDSLSALTLGKALRAAGAVMAMQTDINPFWVRAFLYNRSPNGSLQITKLNPRMQGRGTEYLYGTERDFIYLTRVRPTQQIR